MLDGKVLPDSDDFQYDRVGDTYSLIIGEIFPDDSGTYSCVATNREGSASSCATIFVQGRLLLLFTSIINFNCVPLRSVNL